MQFFGDYHTHTYRSDGFFGGMERNVQAAIRRGFTDIAITDHAFNNPFALTRRSFFRGCARMEYLRSKYPDIRILQGIEADMINVEGDIDVPQRVKEHLDIMLLGYHRFTHFGSAAAFRQIHVPCWLTRFGIPQSRAQVARNTAALIRCIQRQPVDVLAHIGDMFTVDCGEVAKACCDYGVIVELNVKHLQVLRRGIEDMLRTDVNFIASSDAHNARRVGDFRSVELLIEEYGIDRSRILNLSPNVKFRRDY